MKCPRCQAENPAGMRFCGQCAAPLAAVCASCGASNPPENKLCGQCAVSLGKSAQPRFTSPESYTPKHLAEKILTSRSALEGERKQVTVLFADVKGSMELLADRDPEEARKLLDPVIERMMEAVHRYEGTVNQVMGDGIMALFGAPLAQEDHTIRACYAALRMQEAVKRYAEEVRRAEGIPIQIRVGLNSGEVVVRSIGSDLRMDYTAVGQTTHMAARMEQMATPGTILLTQETFAVAEGFVQGASLGPMRVKGLPSPTEVFELTGASPVRSRLHAAAARGLTRFVGRDSEVEQLRQAQERAGAGQGQVVAVVGGPGVGKSRLFWEFTHSHRTQGWLILESSSVSYGKVTAYLPVIDLLKGYFQIEGRDDSRKIREKVTGKVLSLDRELEQTLPPLLALLDVMPEDAAWEQLDPIQRRHRTLDGVRRLLLRESRLQPLLLVFEDLHLVDAETQALLDSLVEGLPTARILLLVNYRPEYQHGWSSKTYYRQFRIDPLPRESVEEILGALLGSDASLDPLKRLLIERTEGNPFFLEEGVRTLVETKVVTGERGTYRLARSVDAVQVPATVRAVLAARIDRLPADGKRLLQAAAAIGHEVPFVVLQAIAEESDEQLRRVLSHLRAAEFLYETRLFPDLEYTFKHALTQEVAYGSLLLDRRRKLHEQIVDAIERLYGHRLGEQLDNLAHHALHGEVWDKAVAYLRQAGIKAAERSAHKEAVACFERALAALKQLPEQRETLEQGIDLRLSLRNSLIPLGEVGAILEHLHEAETLARSLDDRRRQGWVLCYLSACFWLIGHYAKALESAQEAHALGVALDDGAISVYANTALSWTYHSLGDYRLGIKYAAEVVASLQGERVWEHFGVPSLPAVVARTWLVMCLAERGEFAQGVVRGGEAVSLAEASDNPWSVVSATLGLGILYLRKGDPEKAAALLERGLEVCERFNIQVWHPPLAFSLGYTHALSGRIADAIALLTGAVEEARSRRWRIHYSIGIAWLSEVYLLAGRLDEALRLAGEALALSREAREAGHEAYVLRLLGEIAAHHSSTEEAEDYYRQALTLAARLEMRPLVAQCYFGLGRVHLGTEKLRDAREDLIRARDLFYDLDMPKWVARSQAALSEVAARV